jgi:hypothetical protein
MGHKTQSYWVSGVHSPYGVVNNEKTQRFGNWICFRLQVKWEGGDSYCAGSITKN